MASLQEQQRLEAEKARLDQAYKDTIKERRSVIRQLNDPRISEAKRNELNARYEELDAKATQLDEGSIKAQTDLNRVTNQINQGPNPPLGGPGSEIPTYANQNTGGNPNQSTASRYQQAVADDQVRLNQANQGLADTNNQLASIEREKAALAADLRAAPPGSAQQADILARRNQLNQQQAELETQRSGLQDDIRVRENSLATNKNNLSLVEEGNPGRVSAPPPDPTLVTNEPSATVDVDPNAGFPAAPATPVVQDPTVIQDETGTVSNLRRNPETGDLFEPTPDPAEELPQNFDAISDEEINAAFAPPPRQGITGPVDGISPYGEADEPGDPSLSDIRTQPEAVDPAIDLNAPPADAEGEGEVVEFTQDGPVTRTASEAAATADQARVALLRQQASLERQRKQASDGDWRVKLRLAPEADYLYRDPELRENGVLYPLAVTNGVIFPYTPQITSTYHAKYNPYDLTHSNYRGYFYQGSYAGEVQIQATFTAQDTSEANYLLAVIHFFKSVTKMFYGKDAQRGAPPPLVFLQGLGEFQYNLHPCVVQQFNYNLPVDVDYIRARTTNQALTPNLLFRRDRQTLPTNPFSGALDRLRNAGLKKGAVNNVPPSVPTLGNNNPTYVPTKLDMTITLLPVQTREQVSQQFSLKQFANGDLVKGGFW